MQMLKKIYFELVAIKKELQRIRRTLEPSNIAGKLAECMKSEMNFSGSKGKEVRAIDCMALHVQALLDQSENGEKANFAEPCERCPYSMGKCQMDWGNTMLPILKKSTIGISVDKKEQTCK